MSHFWGVGVVWYGCSLAAQVNHFAIRRLNLVCYMGWKWETDSERVERYANDDEIAWANRYASPARKFRMPLKGIVGIPGGQTPRSDRLLESILPGQTPGGQTRGGQTPGQKRQMDCSLKAPLKRACRIPFNFPLKDGYTVHLDFD